MEQFFLENNDESIDMSDMEKAHSDPTASLICSNRLSNFKI